MVKILASCLFNMKTLPLHVNKTNTERRKISKNVLFNVFLEKSKSNIKKCQPISNMAYKSVLFYKY